MATQRFPRPWAKLNLAKKSPDTNIGDGALTCFGYTQAGIIYLLSFITNLAGHQNNLSQAGVDRRECILTRIELVIG